MSGLPETSIQGIVGQCGGRRVFMSFAPASLLHSISFADVLNEETGQGYQRCFTGKHSLDFRKYIQQDGSTTIPLAFNLRADQAAQWQLIETSEGQATLKLNSPKTKVLSQVDCQHRLGYLADLDISLAFMTFIGLSLKEEMEIFNVINGKAKGLSSSLLDFHEAKLANDLGQDRPELYIALKLNEDPASPWKGKLDLGGNKTSGMKRHASLRMIQKAVKRFLKESLILDKNSVEYAYTVVLGFWKAITIALEDEWRDPRRHFVTKGIGVYSLMSLAAELFQDSQRNNLVCDPAYFVGTMSDFITQIDWTNHGHFKGFGGASGADEALVLLREFRNKSRLRLVAHGQ